jgi:hypothetical protein
VEAIQTARDTHAFYVFYPFTAFFHFLLVSDGVRQYVRFASICLMSVESFLERRSIFVYNSAETVKQTPDF